MVILAFVHNAPPQKDERRFMEGLTWKKKSLTVSTKGLLLSQMCQSCLSS